MEIRTTYHKQLRLIQDEILAMGSMVKKPSPIQLRHLKIETWKWPTR